MMETILNSELFWSALAGVFGIAVGAAMLTFALKYAAGWSREAWDRVHGQVPAMIELVNDPDDAILQYIDRYIPGQAAPVLAKAFPVFLRTIADELDKALLAQEVPAVEINVGGAVNA